MKIHYPEELPISAHRQELIEAIQKNDVTIIEGETGSGKSTQIPKMILEALGQNILIACTQPRRIAAISIATRVAEECETDLGIGIGYKIRFDDQTYPGTKIIVCTDGILLQEIKFDVLLSKYDAIFVDEAHERSLRIDFLLGLLKDIQKKRRAQGVKPLKIIIASATLDTAKFVHFFKNNSDKNAEPINVASFSVSGRVFPVAVEYLPVSHEENISTKIAEIVGEIHASSKPGDILIFLPGEHEITSTINLIQSLGFSDLRCLPLFSRLSMVEQTAIFADHENIRHIVVSTNIAETSLTVPGITTVIDSGLARMTDFDVQTGIGSLTVRKISQASAIQRAGRAGRIEPGKCFRLYSHEDYLQREIFTRPEIQRSDLADVVLQMILMGISNIHHFEFMDPPDHQTFAQAFNTLRTLGALDRQEKLTDLGFKMAHLPLDPKISRMLLTAEQYDCVAEVAVISSFLSLKEPFIRPFGDEENADKARSYFQRLGNPQQVSSWKKPYFNGKKYISRKSSPHDANAQSFHSDLLTYLALWKKVFAFPDATARQEYCESHYIDFQTLEKAMEIFQQLTESLVLFYGHEFKHHLEKLQAMLNPEKLEQNSRSNVGILKSISSGFVQNLCQRNSFGNYSSVMVDRIFIHPGSLFFQRQPKWIVATEIIETSRLFARNITEVDPTWFQSRSPIAKSLSRKPQRSKRSKSPKKHHQKRQKRKNR